MNLKKTLIATGAALAVAAGVVLAVLSPSTATNKSTWAIYTKNSDSTLAQIQRQSFANSTAKGQVVAVIKSNRASDSLLIWQINFNGVTPPPPDSNKMVTIGGKASGPVTLKSNTVYQGLTIDLGKTTSTAFTGNNVTNITIKKCKIINGVAGSGNNVATAIYLSGCTNITIDSCLISTIIQGVLIKSSSKLTITHNQFVNILNTPALTLHPIQLQSCNGGGINICYNRFFEDPKVAPFTHDQCSIYQSNGLPKDSIRIISNYFNGNQVIKNAAGNNGANAVGLGDSGGSYQVARGNIIVNALAAVIDGTGTSIKMDHNTIAAVQVSPQSASVGLLYFGKVQASNFAGYNRINFIMPNGKNNNMNPAASTSIPGWSTNKYDPTLTPANAGQPVPYITFQ